MECFSNTPKANFKVGVSECLDLNKIRRRSDNTIHRVQSARSSLSNPQLRIEDDLLSRNQKVKAKCWLKYTKSRAREDAIVTGTPEINSTSRKLAKKKTEILRRQHSHGQIQEQEEPQSKNQVFEVKVSLSGDPELNTDKNSNQKKEITDKNRNSLKKNYCTGHDKKTMDEITPKSNYISSSSGKLTNKPDPLACISPSRFRVGYDTGFNYEYFKANAKPIIGYQPWVQKN